MLEKNSISQQITSIDLFAGAGGVTYGFNNIGIKTLLANEMIPVIAETFIKNNQDVEIIGKSIMKSIKNNV